ncbi:hypothetical protein RKE29_16320 [Streptomyces sp. B1866]|uniref:WXG100 family type VII secretion target n=1 Tax=Streptomyces sp. B1866 TaxID=3075431 RepID=UPI002891A834|nr:hypothetical protein [Streptomyces sp. B1866]MDT3398188.1 hypothetical protein [Streptomyces sp. B1866]
MGNSDRLPPLNACYNTTNFEGMSLDQIHAMVAGTDENEIIRRGQALAGAKRDLEKIGNELKDRVGRVTWAGVAGNAFREWGDDFAKQTLKLAEMTGAVGTAMETAGQALSEVKKALPEQPEGAGTHFTDKKKEQKRVEDVEKARTEALPQMYKLASYYLMSEEAISAQEPPAFKPPPTRMSDDDLYAYRYRYDSPAAGSAGGAGSPAGHFAAAAPSGLHHVTASPPSQIASDGVGQEASQAGHIGHASVPPGTSTSPAENLPSATNTNIDSVTPVPTPTAPSLPGHNAPVPTSGGGTVPPVPVVAPPGLGPVRPHLAPAERVGIPGQANKAYQAANIRPVAPAPAEHGIVGGKPVPQAGSESGVPRGNVIGREAPAAGRGMATGAGSGPVAGRPGSPSSVGRPGVSGASGSGRRLSERPGYSGVASGPQAGTQAVGSGTGSSSAGSRRPGGRRDAAGQNHLADDEESWTVEKPDVVPPVIE